MLKRRRLNLKKGPNYQYIIKIKELGIIFRDKYYERLTLEQISSGIEAFADIRFVILPSSIDTSWSSALIFFNIVLNSLIVSTRALNDVGNPAGGGIPKTNLVLLNLNSLKTLTTSFRILSPMYT